MTGATENSATAQATSAHLVVRPARAGDLEGLHRLALAAGSGMTNMPPDRAILGPRLEASEQAFASEAARAAGSAMFFMVTRPATDLDEEAIVGSVAIFPRIGVEWPFYSYRLTRQAQTYRAMNKTVAHDLLILANDFDGAAEVGGLFVDPSARGSAAGRLAARSRYMFLAEHRDWFGRQVISELRGYQDETGRSPFWDALGREFYDMEFEEADRLNSQTGNQFIADLAPKHPIYANLLAKAARDAIGQPHRDGRRALELLREEGFRYEGYIDIFDGGPTLFADIDDIKTVRDQRRARVTALDDAPRGETRLVSCGHGPGFRCARGHTADDGADGVRLHAPLARALNVKVGDWVRHVAF